jgi:hypothetical protein
MSHQKRSSGLRLEIDHEASALISVWGSGARWVALQRAQEARSEHMVSDWDTVALAIVHRSGKRPSLLSHLFH